MATFKVILADPNWSYDNFGAKDHGAARAHYLGSKVEELARIPVRDWADKDAILLLWATWPKLEEALTLVKAWGATYVTGLPWVKTTPSTSSIYCGIGFWFQSASELLLCARWGKAKAPKRRDPVRGLLCGSERQFYAPTREHSAKPLSIYEWVELKLLGPYLELFARNKIRGWECWGYETGYELYEGGVRPWVKREESAID